jgi:hypothetical protein
MTSFEVGIKSLAGMFDRTLQAVFLRTFAGAVHHGDYGGSSGLRTSGSVRRVG